MYTYTASELPPIEQTHPRTTTTTPSGSFGFVRLRSAHSRDSDDLAFMRPSGLAPQEMHRGNRSARHCDIPTLDSHHVGMIRHSVVVKPPPRSILFAFAFGL